jgi:hypothetical protein
MGDRRHGLEPGESFAVTAALKAAWPVTLLGRLTRTEACEGAERRARSELQRCHIPAAGA